ncbi:MAG: FG-GAP-like repeat-containing protein [Phycisphaerae bacterium]|nr:FG-GAP-like repeat-containing protein [Phycisphaerae bacterium]
MTRAPFRRFASPLAFAPVLAGGLLASAASAQFVEPAQQVLYTLRGAPGEFLGYYGNPIADVDGDGKRDLLLGAPFSDAAITNGGRVYLHSGATGALISTYTGTIGNEFMGQSVDDAGDLNGDGVHDIIAGAAGQPFNSSPGVRGRVLTFSGAPPFGLIWQVPGVNPSDRFGNNVSGLYSDLNGDGVPEVIASATLHDATGTNAGRVYILSGADGAVVRTMDGLANANNHGTAVCSIGDLDGDGKRDVVVAARNDGLPTRGGRAYIYSSATGLTIRPTLIPAPSAVDFGFFFMNSAGDFDGDGTDDVYINDFSDNSLGATTGKAYVFSGASGAEIAQFTGSMAGVGFGIGRMVTDADGDGRADLFVANWIGSAGATQAGQGLLFSSSSRAVLQTMTCNIPNTQAGFDGFGLNDVNNDGRNDYVLTGQGDSPATITRGDGVVYVLAGRVGPTFYGDMNCDGFITVGDIGGFVLALTDPVEYAVQNPACIMLAADTNRDGFVTVGDISGFVTLLTGP